MPADRGTQIIEVPDYEGLLAKYETLQRERDDIHKNLVAVRVAIGDMEKDRDKYKARIRVLEEEAKELQQELGCWESATGCGSHDKGADLIAALRRERTQLDNQLASARKERAQFFADASRNATDREEQRTRAEKAEAKLEALLTAAHSKPCTDCDLTMPLDFAKVCDACKNSLPHALWLLFTAAPMDERRLAGEVIWHILTARNRQNDDRTELRSEIEHLQRVSKAAHERAEKAEQEAVELRADTGRLVEAMRDLASKNEMLVQGVEKAERELAEANEAAPFMAAEIKRYIFERDGAAKSARAAQAELDSWRAATKCKNPEEAGKLLEDLEWFEDADATHKELKQLRQLVSARPIRARWNLNNKITVRFTNRGKNLWRSYVQAHSPGDFTGHEETATLQMWEFIHAFASPNCWMNGADPVVNMHVEIEDVEPGSDPFFAPDVLSMIQRLAVHPIAKMQRCRIRNQAGFILVGEGADSEERIIAAIKELREERDEARQELAGVRAHLDFRKTILDSQAYVIRTKHKKARAWKRSARGFRLKAKMFNAALLLAHKERDEARAALDAFAQSDTQPQIAGFLVANGEAVRFENGNVLPADPQTQIAHLRLEIAQHLAAAQGDREMRKELGDIMGCVSPKNPDKIPSWPLLHNTARGLQRLADQAGEGNSHLWKMVAAAVGDEWKKYHTAGTSMASALCATITGIRQRLAAYEQPFNNLTLLEIEERRAEDADCKALINAIRIERGNVDALKETLQRIARILNFGTAGKADSLVECVGRVHAAWLQARKDLAEHRSNVDTWAYAQLIGRKNAEKRAARAEQKAAAVALRLAEATERCQRDAARLGAVLHWANETDNAIVRGLALGQLP